MGRKAPRIENTAHYDARTRRLWIITEHEDWQSFSRAVRPSARRVAGAVLTGLQRLPAERPVMRSYFGIGQTREGRTLSLFEVWSIGG